MNEKANLELSRQMVGRMQVRAFFDIITLD